MLKEGETLIYCGNTNILHTKNKKYMIKNIKKYIGDDFFICITDDKGVGNWYQINNIEEDTYFKTEKKLRIEKLKYLNEI